MRETVGVAFVGCTHPHIVARLALLQAAPAVQIAGCYDPDPALVAALEQQFGLRGFAAVADLLDQPGVRLAIIEGWDPDNPGYVRAALARGQASLVEKPGAPNLAALQAMVAEVRGHPVPFQIGYQLRYSPVLPHVRRILASGVLGPISLARFHAAAPVGGAAEPWQSVPGDFGGLLFTDGCHMIDLIIQLLGMPRSVQGQILKLPAGPPVLAHGFKRETLAGGGETVKIPLGGLMYEDGAAAVLDYGDKLVSFDITGWEANPWVEMWRGECYGTDGTLLFGLQPPGYQLYVRNPSAGYEPGWHCWQAPRPAAGEIDPTYRGEIEHMLERVRRWDVDNEPWTAGAAAAMQVVTAIYDSARSGTTVTVVTA